MKEPANVDSFLPTFNRITSISNKLDDVLHDVSEGVQKLHRSSEYFAEQILCRKTKIPEAMLELHLLGKQVDELEKPISAISENYRELKEKIKEWGV